MGSRFEAVSLVTSPSYPNSVAWSDENFLAIASGRLVTILNPSMPSGPRGLITIPPTEPFPIGVIESKDLFVGSMLPINLQRNARPCVRSISWSPVGLAPNSGCLLAVCTTGGRVKLYRYPFCEFSAEWVEVHDISEMLYKYLRDVNFLKSDVSSEVSNTFEASDENLNRSRSHRIVSGPKSKTRSMKNVIEPSSVPVISADEYVSRNSMLASLVVAWSPLLQTASEYRLASDDSCNCCSILAVGGKSGMISFWKVHKPQHYSILSSRNPTDVLFVGVLRAHMCWVTAISWVVSVSDSSSHQLLLATGGSDGSVKIWLCHSAELMSSSVRNPASFSLFQEVIPVDSVSVSILSFTVSTRYAKKSLLAVGKYSGTLEVWMTDIYTMKFHKIGSSDSYSHVVTGCAWAFDGNCLYSCNQDNSVHCWALYGNSLCEVSIPSNTLGVESTSNVPDMFDLCFGLAVSPGNLVVAVVRSFDADLLNPMYQIRTVKAAVEFFMTGGQQQILSHQCRDFDVEPFSGLSDTELVNWEYNILWSLDRHKHLDKPLVIADVAAALLAFKQDAPKYVYHILAKWLRSYMGSNLKQSHVDMLSAVSKCLNSFSTRQLHLLNIIIRHVVLAVPKAYKVNVENHSPDGTQGLAEGHKDLWMKLLERSEKELRERLVYCSFSVIVDLVSRSSKNLSNLGNWKPTGLAQMEKWVDLNADVRNPLKVLKSAFRKIKKSKICSVSEYVTDEKCSYCSAPVPFESAEPSVCDGMICSNGVAQRHKLTRCAVTMLVNDITPSWFCISCQRRSSKSAPEALFSMLGYPDDINSHQKITSLQETQNPLCVFCGILLQRSQPQFLLAASPV